MKGWCLSMALNTEYQQFFKKWFSDAHPIAGVKATATLTISNVVSDGEKVVIGSNTYEFDNNDTITAGSITVDMTDYLPKANATLTFEGVPRATETVVLGGGANIETYEFVAESVSDPVNIPVVLGETFTEDNAVAELAEAINTNSALVTAVADDEANTVVVTAIVRGTAGNSIDTTDTCDNADWGDTALKGGLDTITADNAVTALVASINANDEYVTASDGDNGKVVVKYKYVGTDGNSVAVSETLANGEWEDGATKLSTGVSATPVNCPAFIIIDGTWWIADSPVTKYTEGGWKSANPS